MIVGRAATADIVLSDDSVSREHVRLTMGEEVWVTDLGSKNGTALAGGRMDRRGRTKLPPGAPVSIGTVSLTVHAPADAVRGAELVRSEAHAADAIGYLADVLPTIDRIAASDMTVLVLGETGVGKDVVAEVIHRRSSRSAGPFVRIHCSALSPSLIESELFGHERGSFTGASVARDGLLESAHGGTAFLVEIGEIPLAVQVKLLRVLEDRRIHKVGASQPVNVDVRFVAATNRDLDVETREGRFRKDLLFRLNGFTLDVPPLRERRGEVAHIANLCARRCAKDAGAEAPTLAPDFLAALSAYDFPGNIRELRNIVERAYMLSGGATLGAEHLRGLERARSAPAPRGTDTSHLSAVERPDAERILEALAACAGNQTRAAEAMGISRRTLVSKLALYRLPRPTK